MVLQKFSDYKVYRRKDIEAKLDVFKLQVSSTLRDPHTTLRDPPPPPHTHTQHFVTHTHTTLRDPHTTLRDPHEMDWKSSQGEGTGRADIRQTEFLALGKAQATIIQTY